LIQDEGQVALPGACRARIISPHQRGGKGRKRGWRRCALVVRLDCPPTRREVMDRMPPEQRGKGVNRQMHPRLRTLRGRLQMWSRTICVLALSDLYISNSRGPQSATLLHPSQECAFVIVPMERAPTPKVDRLDRFYRQPHPR